MAPRDTKSKAPIPSTDKMVASGFASVNARNAWATHSQQALVDNAHWKGDVASFTASSNCWAMVLDVNLLITSPATMPVTPPTGFRSAVNLPKRKACTATSGALPWANCSAMRKNMCTSLGLSSNGRRCSTTIPDGPGAAPFRADEHAFIQLTCSWGHVQEMVRRWVPVGGVVDDEHL